MLRIHKFNRLFCWFCSLAFVLPAAFANSLSPEEYTELLLASSRQLMDGVSSVEIISERRLEYVRKGWASSRTGRVRIDGKKVRTDIAADIMSHGKDDTTKQIVRRSWSSAFDGKATSTLPHDSPVFRISPGNAVEEYGLFLKGMHMNGMPLDKWLERMEITYSGRAKSEDEGLHRFTGLVQLPPRDDGTPRARRYEMVASDELGFSISSWRIYDEADHLLSEYKAEKFQKIGEDLWVPTMTSSKDYLRPGGELTRKATTKVKYVTVNEPMDSTIFRLSPPPNYTIVDRVHDIVINPSDLESQLLDDEYVKPQPVNDEHLNSVLNLTKSDSNTADTENTSVRPQPASDERPDTHSDKEMFEGKSVSHGTGRIWAYRGLTTIALILTLAAGIMIGRRRSEVRQ